MRYGYLLKYTDYRTEKYMLVYAFSFEEAKELFILVNPHIHENTIVNLTII